VVVVNDRLDADEARTAAREAVRKLPRQHHHQVATALGGLSANSAVLSVAMSSGRMGVVALALAALAAGAAGRGY
jgi:hypothetical protein